MRASLLLCTLCDPVGPLFFLEISEWSMVRSCYLPLALRVGQFSTHFYSAGLIFGIILVLEKQLWFVLSLDGVRVLLQLPFCILPV